MKNSLFCRSFRGEFDVLLRHLDMSGAFTPGLDLLLAVPRDDIGLLFDSVEIPADVTVVVDQEYPIATERSRSGWFQQQICKAQFLQARRPYAPDLRLPAAGDAARADLSCGAVARDDKRAGGMRRNDTINPSPWKDNWFSYFTTATRGFDMIGRTLPVVPFASEENFALCCVHGVSTGMLAERFRTAEGAVTVLAPQPI